jgi:hypothetical protein
MSDAPSWGVLFCLEQREESLDCEGLEEIKKIHCMLEIDAKRKALGR